MSVALRIAARVGVLVAGLVAGPLPAQAHRFNVFATADCEAVHVEAGFAGGAPARAGEVQLRDGADVVVATATLGDDGTARVPLDGIDTSGGLTVAVETGDHSDYWVLTPEDIARGCPS